MKTKQSGQCETTANPIRAEAVQAEAADTPKSLRSMFRTLGGPALRVHRYRDWHTRLLREAYCHADTPKRDPQDCLHG